MMNRRRAAPGAATLGTTALALAFAAGGCGSEVIEPGRDADVVSRSLEEVQGLLPEGRGRGDVPLHREGAGQVGERDGRAVAVAHLLQERERGSPHLGRARRLIPLEVGEADVAERGSLPGLVVLQKSNLAGPLEARSITLEARRMIGQARAVTRRRRRWWGKPAG